MARRALVPAAFALAISACKTSAPNDSIETPPSTQTAEQTAPLVEEPKPEKPMDATGAATRAEIEAYDGWSVASAQEPDADVAKKLAAVPPGARIEVYVGTWCGDSRREVPRFWKALDLAGEVPFEVTYVGLNREFYAGDVSLEGKDIEAVPTFVVYRDSEEVGRVVERAVGGIESDLVALLDGSKSGKISASR